MIDRLMVEPLVTIPPLVRPLQATGVDGSIVAVSALVLVEVGESVAVGVSVLVGV